MEAFLNSAKNLGMQKCETARIARVCKRRHASHRDDITRPLIQYFTGEGAVSYGHNKAVRSGLVHCLGSRTLYKLRGICAKLFVLKNSSGGTRQHLREATRTNPSLSEL